MLIGLLNKFEIWDESKWHQQMQLDTEIERAGDFEMTPEFENFSL
jgi:MraZ protein